MKQKNSSWGTNLGGKSRLALYGTSAGLLATMQYAYVLAEITDIWFGKAVHFQTIQCRVEVRTGRYTELPNHSYSRTSVSSGSVLPRTAWIYYRSLSTTSHATRWHTVIRRYRKGVNRCVS